MAYFRLGRLDDALADYNAALNGAPGLAPTLYMRGIVRTSKGDAAGIDDIRQALRMSPSIAEQYARYGIKAPN
jgi:tetratricopeptide (TPR) repeat protein